MLPSIKMPDNSNGSRLYSHDNTVTALNNYLSLVCLVHATSAPGVSLQFPPPGGWPLLTREAILGTGLSDACANLIRHIPYLNSPVDILPQVRSPDFISETTIKHWETKGRAIMAARSEHNDTNEAETGMV
ncbi:hypothetical protein F5Y17DRAFT_445378, partial [Xylariaceae sp. FL0594]